ncbi:MAG TPA: amidohydrolase [Chloroflexota bacterium]|nr:amidohydrolase [Chloroflexota bacterium]
MSTASPVEATATAASLKAAVCDAIDRRGEEVIRIADDIYHHPELGFKEWRTARIVSDYFERLGLPHRDGLAITGVKATMAGQQAGPTVAVLGELDALAVRGHLQADPETGAAHACGHNAQIAMMLAVAAGFVDAGLAAHLAGNVVFFAVPAEEYVEIEYRNELARQGKLEFLGGKPELIRLGEFDGVQLAMMTHTSSNREDGALGISESNNGCVVKLVRFIGKAAHAGGAPHRGVNALNAATLAIQAIHAQRETFRDADTVRVHPIITRGGDVVNVVPADVRLETFVRGKTVEAIEDANRKVDRALKAGALAVGGQVAIETLPGYLPLQHDPELTKLYLDNAAQLVGEGSVKRLGHRTGSTDMGDISHIMPSIHPYAAGAEGTGHGVDYRITDPEGAILKPAKAMAMTVVDLLVGNAAQPILQAARPRFTKEEYLAFQRRLKQAVTFDGSSL